MKNEVRVEEDGNHMTSQIVVDTSVDSVYNNTLRVRGKESGIYKCTVSSNRNDGYYSSTKSVAGMYCTFIMCKKSILLTSSPASTF